MYVLEKNNSRICCCEDAISNGIFNKTFNNNSFSIYGSIMNGRKILIRYNGKLCNNTKDNDTDKKNNIYLYYCFNNDWNNKKILTMNICTQQFKLSQCYCVILEIPIDECISTINMAFTDDNEVWDTDTSSTYSINICPDIEKKIIERYNLNSAPPTIINSSIKKFDLFKQNYIIFIKRILEFLSFRKKTN